MLEKDIQEVLFSEEQLKTRVNEIAQEIERDYAGKEIMLISVLYIMDGAPKEARGMWAVCVAMAIFILMLTMWIGNMIAKSCVYFNQDYIQIERPFRETQIVKWYEIRRVGGNYKNAIQLYRLDETKILTAYISMVNYERFCDVLKQKLKMEELT